MVLSYSPVLNRSLAPSPTRCEAELSPVLIRPRPPLPHKAKLRSSAAEDRSCRLTHLLRLMSSSTGIHGMTDRSLEDDAKATSRGKSLQSQALLAANQ